MFATEKPPSYYTGCNEALLRAVPSSARRILDVGCGQGLLGARLKGGLPGATVFGIECEPAIAAQAATRLDRVFALDVQAEDPPLEAGSLDCILYGDVLEHLVAPDQVLTRHRRLLGPDGVILCSVPNVQHHSLVAALLKSDFQYAASGLLDATHLRFFTYSTFIKLLLDAGFAPRLVETLAVSSPPEFLTAAGPLFRYLGLHPERTRRYLDAYQYIFEGRPLADPEPAEEGEPPLSFVVCVSDEQSLRDNLLSSPCLGPGSPHEVLPMRHCGSAAEGLNRGRTQARHPLVVCVHQDVYLPRGWPARFWQQYRLAEKQLGKIGLAGVYGVALRGAALKKAGHVVDRDRLLRESEPLPAAVDTLDELLLAVPRDLPLSFDPRLGFHLYGADLCLAARQQGLAAVALDALCFHHSPHVGLPPEFAESGRLFAAKWSARLPLATPCVLIDRHGRMTLS